MLISFSGRTKQIFFLVIDLEPRLSSWLQPRKNNFVPTELDVSISAYVYSYRLLSMKIKYIYILGLEKKRIRLLAIVIMSLLLYNNLNKRFHLNHQSILAIKSRNIPFMKSNWGYQLYQMSFFYFVKKVGLSKKYLLEIWKSKGCGCIFTFIWQIFSLNYQAMLVQSDFVSW